MTSITTATLSASVIQLIYLICARKGRITFAFSRQGSKPEGYSADMGTTNVYQRSILPVTLPTMLYFLCHQPADMQCAMDRSSSRSGLCVSLHVSVRMGETLQGRVGDILKA